MKTFVGLEKFKSEISMREIVMTTLHDISKNGLGKTQKSAKSFLAKIKAGAEEVAKRKKKEEKEKKKIQK